MISEIEEELKRISPWPWKVNPRGWVDDSENYPIKEDIENFAFIAQSPERIAVLIEYVRAAEQLMSNDTPLTTELKRHFQAARKGLGLTK